MRILAFAASMRHDSLNRKLLRLSVELARHCGAQLDVAEFREFEMPIFDGDLNAASGLPPGAQELKRRVDAADALLIASPEYNYSIGGPLKNAVDWVSRARPMPWKGKSLFLMSASPSAMGGIRGLWQARIPFEGCGTLVFPDMFALPHADKAFDSEGRLSDPALRERLEREILGFVRLAEAVAELNVTAPKTAPQHAIAASLEDESRLQELPRH